MDVLYDHKISLESLHDAFFTFSNKSHCSELFAWCEIPELEWIQNERAAGGGCISNKIPWKYLYSRSCPHAGPLRLVGEQRDPVSTGGASALAGYRRLAVRCRWLVLHCRPKIRQWNRALREMENKTPRMNKNFFSCITITISNLSGNALLDVASVVGINMNPEERRQHEDEIIREYVETISEKCDFTIEKSPFAIDYEQVSLIYPSNTLHSDRENVFWGGGGRIELSTLRQTHNVNHIHSGNRTSSSLLFIGILIFDLFSTAGASTLPTRLAIRRHPTLPRTGHSLRWRNKGENAHGETESDPWGYCFIRSDVRRFDKISFAISITR